MTKLWDPLDVRGLTIPHRVWLPPMCQYHVLNRDGVPEDWHLMHYGARAVGGYGLIMVESAGVVPEGRISPQCVGLWSEEQVTAWRRIVDFVHAQSSVIGVQLNHAGRKGSIAPTLPDSPTYGGLRTVPASEGGWETVGPSAIAQDLCQVPRELSDAEVRAIPGQFAAAAKRAVSAGFDVVEVHAAHGYLLHEFLSAVSNRRTDEWGGSWENRTRLVREVVTAVRAVIPFEMPLFVRVSATDWDEDPQAWEETQTKALCTELVELGVDLIDVSTGGVANAGAPLPTPPEAEGYQVPFASALRQAVSLPTVAAGLIVDPAHAARIVDEGEADAVYVGREGLLRSNWPQWAAHRLGLGAVLPPHPHYWRAEF